MKVILIFALILCYASTAEKLLGRYEIVQPLLKTEDNLLKIIVESKIYDFEITLHLEKDESGFLLKQSRFIGSKCVWINH